MNLFNLVARISLDDREFNRGVDEASNKGDKLGKVFGTIGNGIAKMGQIAAVSVGAVATGLGALTKTSISQYAEFEQLVGGVETLFKDSAGMVQRFADNAFMSAGLSANEYMETITSFSASLLQGLGGDTEKAARLGNQAVTDMSDNANKMGTSMESIQNAYNGFSKANFTMLDNLKLGYGGTKEEMKRLLVDAEKLTGVKYDIDNFADIINGIHVIQTELGITGTTALEAEQTISGSANAMKSAWINMLTGFSNESANLDDLINDLVRTVGVFAGNVLPRMKVALEGIGKVLPVLAEEFINLGAEILPSLMETGGEVVQSLINGIITALPKIVNAGVDVIKSITSGIKTSLPNIMQSALEIMNSLVTGIVEILPMLLEVGLQALITLGQGIATSLPTLIPIIVNLVLAMCDMIIENLPLILDVAIQIILALVQGLITALPTLIQEVPRIINSFSNAIYEALPQILKSGVDILLMLIKGLIDSIPVLVANIPQIILAIVNVFTLMNWASIGKNLISGIGSGITSMLSNITTIARNIASGTLEAIKGLFAGGGSVGMNLIRGISSGISSMLSGIVSAARGVGSSVLSTLKGIFSWSTMSNIGSDLIRGIWSGISNMTGWIINLIGGFAGSVVKSIKGFFGIHSPSRVLRDEVGVYMAQGIGVGFDEEMEDVNGQIQNSLTYDFDTPTLEQKNTDNTNNTIIMLLQQLVNKEQNINIDGRETMKVLSKYQEEFDRYNSRNPRFA